MSLPDMTPNHVDGLVQEEKDDTFVSMTRSEPLVSSHSHRARHANANANATSSVGTHSHSHATPISWAYHNDEYEVPVEDPFAPAAHRPSSHPSDDDDDSFFPPSMDADRSNHATSRHGQQHPHAPPKKKDSFRDWLAAGAVDFLKLTGGVALTTTEFLVSPPLQMTRLLLPSLLAALLEYIDLVTPPRCKDWFQIVSSSIYHVISVLKHTDKGKEFRTQVGNVGGDLRELLSSDVVRQVLMDHMAANVKMAEALHTPEMHAWLDQLSVLGCRLVDAAASGTNKQLIHDVYDLVWSGVEVLADPQSTLAAAEVTAYLCHALEMENALPRPNHDTAAGPNATRRYQRNAQQSQTYGTQTQVLQDPDATVEQVILSSLGNANYIIDDIANGNGGTHLLDGITSSSIPSNVNVVLNDNNMDYNNHDTDGAHNVNANVNIATSSSLDWNPQAAKLQNQVDIPYLQQQMEQRARLLQQENRRTNTNTTTTNPFSSISNTPLRNTPVATNVSSASKPSPGRTIPSSLPTNTKNENEKKIDTKDDDNYMDMEDLVLVEPDDDRNNKPACNKSRPQEREDPSQRDQQHLKQHRLQGETAVMHFYRILDEVMQEKRESRVNELLGSDNVGMGVVNENEPQHQSWYPRAAAAAGAGNERGQETMKRRLASLKRQRRAVATTGDASEIGVGSSSAFTTADAASNFNKLPNLRDFVNQRRPPTATTKSKAMTDMTAIYHQYKTLILVGVGVASLMVWIVSAFAMYGMYKFFFPAGLGWLTLGLFSSSSLNIPIHLQESATSTAAPQATTSSSEIVIRVIRQVVHVNQDGTILEQLTADPIASAATLSTENLDGITQCLVAALD